MNMAPTFRNHFLSIATLAISMTAMTGCGGNALTKYDENTYQQVTFVKPQILATYDTFKTDPLNQPKIDETDLKLAQLQTYEAGKGPANVEMTQQVESIQKLFRKHVAERKRDGVWNEVVTNDHKEIISEACDLAIKTEAAKNR
jgi:hypothetical protein